MFIRKMSESECRKVLKRTNLGRLGCAHDNQPYVLPINLELDDQYLYGFATFGQKIDWMRKNPLVCFEVDEVTDQNSWISVIVFGRYEELPNEPNYEEARGRALELLQKRAMWWEPATISKGHTDWTHFAEPIVFRIRIESMTGHRANR